jgi:hypothetical protein
MNTNKLVLGTLIGGIAVFLSGWLLYGIVFANALASAMPKMHAAQKEPDMVAMLLGNMALAFLLAYVFERWAGIRTFIGGLIGGATIGLLAALGYDGMFHATTNLMTWNGLILDTLIFGAMCAIAGGVIGAWLGYNRK